MNDIKRTWEEKIALILGMEVDDLIFEFCDMDNASILLNLYTKNPYHKEVFLFNSVEALNKEQAFVYMEYYAKNHKIHDKSYTVQWQTVGEHELQTSYFRAKDMYQVLNKFYYNKDAASIILFNISLNPIS